MKLMSRGIENGSAVIELDSLKYSVLGLRRGPALSRRQHVVSASRPSPSDKHRTVPALIPHAVPSAAALGMLVGGAVMKLNPKKIGVLLSSCKCRSDAHKGGV